jgi:hypothetical protein
VPLAALARWVEERRGRGGRRSLTRPSFGLGGTATKEKETEKRESVSFLPLLFFTDLALSLLLCRSAAPSAFSLLLEGCGGARVEGARAGVVRVCVLRD